MISALAARRAKRPPSPTPSSPSPSPSPPPTPAPATPKNKAPNSKRKRDSEDKNKQKKKRRKKQEKDKEKGRYYAQEPDLEPEEDENDHIILVDDEEDEEIEGDTPDTTTEPPQSRAYSPSAPIGHQPPKEDPIQLSASYHPILNQNLFQIPSSSTETDPKSVLISLKIDDTLALVGTYTLRVVQGSVSLCGTTLHASSGTHKIFAIQSAPIPVITAVESESIEEAPEEFKSLVGESDDTLIVVSELRTGIEGLGRVCRIFDVAFRPPLNASSTLELRGVYLVTPETSKKGLHPFVLPVSWDLALPSFASSEKNEPGVYLVKGPKKSGKSTFARTLANRLLERYPHVVYLETDLGQSEFTPPGIVSLTVLSRPVFGPPWTHPTLSHPNHAHFIGSLTPKSSPAHYLSAIQSLIETFRLDLQYSGTADHTGIPLVVNTMGWTKGLGGDLIKRIEELTDPTHIFEFEGPANEFGGWNPQPQPQPQPPAKAKTYTLEPILDIPTNYTPADNRTISILSYFFSSFPSPPPSTPTQTIPTPFREGWDTTLPLLARYPFQVDIKTAFDKIILTGAGSEDVVPDELPSVLNGSIVGLVSSSSSEDPDALYKQAQVYPSPQTSHLLGLTFIRGVSASGDKVHILTPVPPGMLGNARVLVKGEMEMPVWGWLDYRLPDGEEAEKGKPYLQWGKGSGIGGERRRVRRNLMRRGQA